MEEDGVVVVEVVITTSESSSASVVSRAELTSITARGSTSWQSQLELRPTHTRQAVVSDGVWLCFDNDI